MPGTKHLENAAACTLAASLQVFPPLEPWEPVGSMLWLNQVWGGPKGAKIGGVP